MNRIGRALGLVLLACVAGVLYAGWAYRRYAGVWLRDPPKVPACVIIAGRALRKPVAASGVEPHEDVNGNTVHLTAVEDRAVRCLKGSDAGDLARRFTTAFAEHEPERRGLELLKIMRDVPAGAEHDKNAHFAYRFAEHAIAALPQLPEIKAAGEELDLLYACRFRTKLHCPTKPAIPVGVWLVGIPSALGLLFVLSIPSRELITRLVERIRSRGKPAAPPEPPAQASEPPPPVKKKGSRRKKRAAADGESEGSAGSAPAE